MDCAVPPREMNNYRRSLCALFGSLLRPLMGAGTGTLCSVQCTVYRVYGQLAPVACTGCYLRHSGKLLSCLSLCDWCAQWVVALLDKTNSRVFRRNSLMVTASSRPRNLSAATLSLPLPHCSSPWSPPVLLMMEIWKYRRFNNCNIIVRDERCLQRNVADREAVREGERDRESEECSVARLGALARGESVTLSG